MLMIWQGQYPFNGEIHTNTGMDYSNEIVSTTIPPPAEGFGLSEYYRPINYNLSSYFGGAWIPFGSVSQEEVNGQLIHVSMRDYLKT